MSEKTSQPVRVMVEIQGASGVVGIHDAATTAAGLESTGFELDLEFEPVPMGVSEHVSTGQSETFIVYGTVTDKKQIKLLEARTEVVAVWPDTKVAPFESQ